MKDSYAEYIPLFKALADETRLKIVDLLTSGETCACQLLENFDITQPTLSYHMKILCDSGIVKGRRNGTWMYYSNNDDIIGNVSELLSNIMLKKDNCMGKYDGTSSGNGNNNCNCNIKRKYFNEAVPPNK